MAKPTRWMDCENCEGTGRVDASLPDEGSVRWEDCGSCEGDGEQRCEHCGCSSPADCLAVCRMPYGLVDMHLCWDCFDELAADGKIAALIEWRDEPPRMMDDVEEKAKAASWTLGHHHLVGERGRDEMSVAIVGPMHLLASPRDAFKLAALAQRAAHFASQDVAEE